MGRFEARVLILRIGAPPGRRHFDATLSTDKSTERKGESAFTVIPATSSSPLTVVLQPSGETRRYTPCATRPGSMKVRSDAPFASRNANSTPCRPPGCTYQIAAQSPLPSSGGASVSRYWRLDGRMGLTACLYHATCFLTAATSSLLHRSSGALIPKLPSIAIPRRKGRSPDSPPGLRSGSCWASCGGHSTSQSLHCSGGWAIWLPKWIASFIKGCVWSLIQ